MKNPEAVQKWVAALRSGEFKQASGMLYDKSIKGHCCLGVACVLAKREGVIPKNIRWGYGNGIIMGALEERFEPVKEWLGLENRIGTFIDSTLSSEALAHLNDDGKSFSDLADLIESNPKGLFVQ